MSCPSPLQNKDGSKIGGWDPARCCQLVPFGFVEDLVKELGPKLY